MLSAFKAMDLWLPWEYRAFARKAKGRVPAS